MSGRKVDLNEAKIFITKNKEKKVAEKIHKDLVKQDKAGWTFEICTKQDGSNYLRTTKPTAEEKKAKKAEEKAQKAAEKQVRFAQAFSKRQSYVERPSEESDENLLK